MNTQSYYKEILKKFDKLTQKEYSSLSLTGIQLALMAASVLFLVLSISELIGNFSSIVRTSMFFVFLVASFALILYLFIYPLIRSFNLFGRDNYDNTAKKVGMLFPSIKDDLINAMQLIRIKDNKTVYSDSLKEAAFQQIYLRTESVDFSGAITLERPKKLLKYTLGIVGFAAVLFIFVPGLQAASGRLVNFSRQYIPPVKFIIDVMPGSKEITKGESILIVARIHGPKPSEVALAVKTVEQTDFEFKRLTADSSGLYTFEIPSARSSFQYFVMAEDVKSDQFSITVVDKPIIRSLDVNVTQPSYSKLPPIEQKDNGNVTALVGSQMSFNITSTKPLKEAKLLLSDSSSVSLQVDGRNASGTYRIKKDVDYKIFLRDADGHTNDNPVNYSIKTLADASPVIEFVSPNKDVNLANDDRLPLLVKISDDYGFSRLVVHYRLAASKRGKPQDNFSTVDIPISRLLKEQDVNYIWNLAPQMLSADDIVVYYLEVFDNDVVNGPKAAKTGVFSIRVPSMDEIFAQADKTQQTSEQKLSETLNEAQKLKDNLEKLSQDLKQDRKDITWQEKEKVEKAMQQFEQLSQKVDDVRKDLGKMQNEMQQNNLLSKETLQKYMELQDLFKQLSSEEMRKAMEKMQSSLQQLNRDNVQQNMDQMKFDEDMFKKSVERTLKLLKRAQAEQKMDEVLKRTEQLSQKIDQLKNETQKSNLNDNNQKEDLKSQQKDVTEDTKELEEKMRELQNKMNELEDMPKDQMKQAMDQFDQQQNSQLSQQAEQQINQGQKQQAGQNQSKLSQNMKNNKQSMNNLQKQMQRQNQMQAFNEMRKILDNLLTLSKEQENLKDQTQSLDPNSSQFKEGAKKQNSIQSNMEKILQQMTKTSQKTFAISPEMGRSLGKANNSMRQSVQELQSRNSYGAQAKQSEAMGALNESAMMLKQSMQSLMNGGGQGGGMMSLMQQLQQLSQQQMNLNNMTQQMNKGGLSMAQQAELRRLAQQQDMIRKSLEQLNKESRMEGQSKKMPANLDNVSKEMQEVVSDMRTQKLNDNVIQKQERILSKLLEAQRSINDRDFEKERESNAGQNIAGKDPGALNLPAQRRNRIKDELMKAVQEGYSKDYENLIRKYYEALDKQK